MWFVEWSSFDQDLPPLYEKFASYCVQNDEKFTKDYAF